MFTQDKLGPKHDTLQCFPLQVSMYVSHIIGISDFPPAVVLGHSNCVCVCVCVRTYVHVCVFRDAVASPARQPGQMTGADVKSS